MCAHLGEVVDSSKFEEGGHAVGETAYDEPVKGCGITHLHKNIAKQFCNNFKKGKKGRKTVSFQHLGKLSATLQGDGGESKHSCDSCNIA